MSAAFFSVDPIIDPLLACGILVCLTLLFQWLEYKRRAPFVRLRMLSVLLMMLGIAGILIRPQHKTSVSSRLILLTPGYNSSQADSLVNVYPEAIFVHTPGAPAFRNSRILSTDVDISGGGVSFVLGHGLPADSLDMFQLSGYRFLGAPYPEGIIRLAMPQQILPNRTNTIEGVYNNRSGKPARITLESPGGGKDSVIIADRGYQTFELSFQSRQAGNYLFAMQVNGEIEGYLPVHVQEHQPLNIFFVQRYPSFETRYLKQYLSDRHRLALRYQVSRNNYRHEFINRAQMAVGRLTKKLLLDFDAIIIDSDALRLLSTAEKTQLFSAIQDGLGMVVLFNSAPSQLENIGPLKFKSHTSDTAHIRLPGNRNHILPTWTASAYSVNGLVSVLENGRRVLSGYQYHGMGKIGFSLLQESYRLTLRGDSADYSAVWSPLIEATARAREPGLQVRTQSTFPHFPDRPVDLQIVSAGAKPALWVNRVALPLKENAVIDDLWEGMFWPGESGWNTVVSGSDSARTHLYVSGHSEWRRLALANKADATQRLATVGPLQKSSDTRFTPVGAWIFYLLFLAAAAVLWLLPRV